MFGSGTETTRNLEGAVVRLGMQQVMGLVYAPELPRTFKKSKAVDWDQVVSTANRIANQHGMTHPIMTAFEDPPEEGYLDNLGVSQEEMGIVIDTTKTGLMVAETIFRSN